MAAVLSAAVLFGVDAVVAPDSARAREATAMCLTNLRTRSSTDARIRTRIARGTEITAVAVVVGTPWRATCSGRTVSGRSWYRISEIEGRSVRSLYGVRYLYAARGLFPSVAPPSQPRYTEGIDVSHWQGTINWSRVREAGKRFAFIKASEDTAFVDWKYARNRSEARAAGLLVGAYHFARPEPGSSDPVAEADHFIRTARFFRGDLLPVLDLEVTGGLGRTELRRWTGAFMERLYQRTGVKGVIYTSPAFWEKYMGNSRWFADNGYKVLWIAHWTSAPGPRLPADNWGGEGWTFWQYTSDGRVSGIQGRVDLNRYRGTDFSEVRIP